MTDSPDNKTIMVGPLTPQEWVSFALQDDARNPLPACCADISEVRDAVFDMLRAGGDPEICWRHLASVWPIVDRHLPLPITDPKVPAALRKLHETYVAGRDIPDRESGFAHLLAQKPDKVRALLAEVSQAWDVETAEGRMRALTRIGGQFVGYILDPAERSTVIRELAATIGMSYDDVALVVDALRLANGLAYEPAEGARVR